MKLLLTILAFVLLGPTATVGQNVSSFTQEISTEGVSQQSSIPAYIDSRFKSLLLLPYKEALDSLNLFMEKTPGDRELIYYRTWCHFINGEFFKAYEDATLYLNQRSSNYYYGYVLLAKIQFERLSKFQALQALDQAIALEPKKPEAYLEKSKIYVSTKNLEEGLTFVQKCIKLFPNESRFYIYRGYLFSDSDNAKKAIANFNTYLNSPSATDSTALMQAYFGLGKSYLMIKNFNEALAQTNRGLQLSPDHSPGYGLRGEIYFRLKDYDAALKDFKKMEEELKASYYWIMIANIYEIKGDLEMACSYYNQHCNLFHNTEGCSKLRKLNCKGAK